LCTRRPLEEYIDKNSRNEGPCVVPLIRVDLSCLSRVRKQLLQVLTEVPIKVDDCDVGDDPCDIFIEL
jgi:hypothetical protein